MSNEKEIEKEKKRATKNEKEKRIFIVQGWIIEGFQDHIIVKNIINNGI